MLSHHLHYSLRLLGLLAALLAWPLARAAATDLPAQVRQALQQAQVPASALSVLVAPADGEGVAARPRLAHREAEPMNPASVMKLFTTLAGLELLGPDFVWRTQVMTEGPLLGGVLQGDLVLRGGGDPKLVVERAQALVAQIRAAGVQDVRGDIVLDRSVFDLPARTEAFDDEPLRPYNVAPDGLLMNFRSVIYTFSPDAASGRARVRTEPPLAGLQAPPEVALTAGPCNDWRGSLRADFGSGLQPRFADGYPASCGERFWPVAFPSADHYAPRMVEALWRQAGGQLSGQVRWGNTPLQARPLLSFDSLPLREVIADINKMSNNVMAQQLFLTLSSELGAPGRWAASRLRVSQWWRQRFAGLPEPVLENGSGLSREERSTARSLSALLRQGRQGPLGAAFTESLGIAGVDGTVVRLAERLPQSPVLGRAWLKTGSLRDVASVAGYVQGESGRLYTVVAIVNHPNAAQARPALDQVLDWTARDQGAPMAAKTPRPRRRQ
jgi:D-alanyl-D-alanine carboxypeptidase/D-alanyl-D-alanine-endopeptidase (penicillin-binding protein 4)